MAKPFRFKQFTIDDSFCAMKVGVDAVLLGAWTDTVKSEKILDIGTGTAIIALMLAQKSNAMIDAVEIDKEAHEQALINIKNSPWKERVSAHHSSIQDYCLSNTSKYDLIVTNPPYFINSFKAPENIRNIARHNDLLSHDDIIEATLCLLDLKGRLCLILPLNEAKIFINLAKKHHLCCNKITAIKAREEKAPHRLMLEFSFSNLPLLETELIIEEGIRHHYTEAYKTLTKDFYLAF